ncbi:RNB domain-containing ribonuclease, partial [candidate division KSB1 bacterium]|nr:RNB domain-containing ribonuclease [candidate division KSB1 bacterium]
VREVLGDPDDPEIQYKIVCHTYEIPLEFPKEVLQEAELAEEPDEKGIQKRKDFRKLLTVTIDGETSRDFDDAISIEKLKNGHFRLWVHIADVSHYVRPDTPLDREALLRGTSVYFPDRAVPMLPEKLSNQVCSLNPKVDRLTMSAVMEVDGQGQVANAEFFRSVICSDERMTYTAVNKILIDQDQALRRRYKPLLESFGWMLELSRILRAMRVRRGAIDFDLPEAESEIVAGFHTEYSGFKWAAFFLAEYANMFMVGVVGATLFLGGWSSPFGDFMNSGPFQIFWIFAKAFGLIFVQIWIRWTLPRVRVDQLMYTSWKVLTPFAFVAIIGVGFYMIL